MNSLKVTFIIFALQTIDSLTTSMVENTSATPRNNESTTQALINITILSSRNKSELPGERAFVFPYACVYSSGACLKLCLDKFAADFKRAVCVNNKNCFCLKRKGYIEPPFDECASRLCWEANSIGSILCRFEGACEQMCNLEYETKLSVCHNKKCYCATTLDTVTSIRKGLHSKNEMVGNLKWIVDGKVTNQTIPGQFTFKSLFDRTVRYPGSCEDDSCEVICKQRLGKDFDHSLCTFQDACYCLKKKSKDAPSPVQNCTNLICTEEISLGAGLCVNSDRACSLMCYKKYAAIKDTCHLDGYCICTISIPDNMSSTVPPFEGLSKSLPIQSHPLQNTDPDRTNHPQGYKRFINNSESQTVLSMTKIKPTFHARSQSSFKSEVAGSKDDNSSKTDEPLVIFVPPPDYGSGLKVISYNSSKLSSSGSNLSPIYQDMVEKVGREKSDIDFVKTINEERAIQLKHLLNKEGKDVKEISFQPLNEMNQESEFVAKPAHRSHHNHKRPRDHLQPSENRPGIENPQSLVSQTSSVIDMVTKNVDYKLNPSFNMQIMDRNGKREISRGVSKYELELKTSNTSKTSRHSKRSINGMITNDIDQPQLEKMLSNDILENGGSVQQPVIRKEKGCLSSTENCYSYCINILGDKLDSYVCDTSNNCYCVNERFTKEIKKVCNAVNLGCYFTAPLGQEMKCQESKDYMQNCQFLCFKRLFTFGVQCQKNGDCFCYVTDKETPQKWQENDNNVLLVRARCVGDDSCNYPCEYEMGGELEKWFCVGDGICACFDKKNKVITRCDLTNEICYKSTHMGRNTVCGPEPATLKRCLDICLRIGGQMIVMDLLRQYWCTDKQKGLIPPTDHGPVFPPIGPGPVFPPTGPGPVFPPINPGPVFPPISPGPVFPPIGPGPVFPPIGPGPVFPPIGPGPVFPPTGPGPVFPPINPGPVFPPTGPGPVFPPINPGPVFPPISPGPVFPPIGPGPVFPPIGPGPVFPPIGPGPVFPPTGPGPVFPPINPGPVFPPTGPGPVFPPINPGPVFPPTGPGPVFPPINPGPVFPPISPGPVFPPIGPGPVFPPTGPGPVFPPINPGPVFPPTGPGPVFPPINPGPVFPPISPGPVFPPIGPGPVFPPTDPGPVFPPTGPGPVFPPINPGPVFPPISPGPVFPPTDPGSVFPPIDHRPVFPPIDHRPVFPPIDHRPVFPPIGPGPVFPPIDHRPVFPPIGPGPVFPPIDHRPVFPPIGPGPVFPPTDPGPGPVFPPIGPGPVLPSTEMPIMPTTERPIITTYQRPIISTTPRITTETPVIPTNPPSQFIPPLVVFIEKGCGGTLDRCRDLCIKELGGEQYLESYLCAPETVSFCVCVSYRVKLEATTTCSVLRHICIDYAPMGKNPNCTSSLERGQACLFVCGKIGGYNNYFCDVNGVCRCSKERSYKPMNPILPPIIYVKGICDSCRDKCRNVGREFLHDTICVNKDCYCVMKTFMHQTKVDCTNGNQNCVARHLFGPEVHCKDSQMFACTQICSIFLKSDNVSRFQSGEYTCDVNIEGTEEKRVSDKDVIILKCLCPSKDLCERECRKLMKNNFGMAECDTNAKCYCVSKQFETRGQSNCSRDQCQFKIPIPPRMKCNSMAETRQECKFLCEKATGTKDVSCETSGICFCYKWFTILRESVSRRLKCLPDPVKVIPGPGFRSSSRNCSKECNQVFNSLNMTRSFISTNEDCFCESKHLRLNTYLLCHMPRKNCEIYYGLGKNLCSKRGFASFRICETICFETFGFNDVSCSLDGTYCTCRVVTSHGGLI